jgi:nitrate/nitrite transporter NarK
LAYIAYGGSAASLLFFPAVHDANLAMAIMGLSSFLVELSAPVTWTAAMDMGGDSVGLLTGMMNTLGQLGGSVAPAAIGYVLAATRNNWSFAFYSSAALYALGGLCWMAVDPVTPVDAASHSRM